MSRVLLLLAVAVAIVTATIVAPPPVKDCAGAPNTIPINRDAPVFVKAVTNGKRFIAGKGNDTFHVLHVWGSHYEMGFAQGQLMAEFFPAIDTAFNNFLLNELLKYVKLPDWLAGLIAVDGVGLLLKWTAEWTGPFTPKKYMDELEGMAAGANYSFTKLYYLNLVPELLRAACTIVGATKSATSNGQIAHLRGLDFMMAIPVRDWPQVTVYHGDGSQPVVANFGWTPLNGALTGISNRAIGLGEKLWWGDNAIWQDGVRGQPWMTIMRDVLYTTSVDEALQLMQRANRTCAIHVGVGDQRNNEFRGVQMAKKTFEVFNWSSIDYPEHPVIKDIMYWDKYTQPTHSYCLESLLNHYHGNITAELLAMNIAPTLQTGDYHAVAFDYAGMQAYFANAIKTTVTVGAQQAFNRQFTWLNLTALWAEEAPQV